MDDYSGDEGDDLPEYDSPWAVGDPVNVVGTLAVTNTSGGTAVIRQAGVECEITKSFWDYEVGWSYWGRVPEGAALEAIREQATTQHGPDFYRANYPANPEMAERAEKSIAAFDPSIVFFTEHDIAPRPAPILPFG